MVEDAYLQIADAKNEDKKGLTRHWSPARNKGTNETENYRHILLHVHLDGVRRMSFLTGLLLFFSRSFTSLHDRTFEKTIFVADESLTGSNNITLDTLALFASQNLLKSH